jgi:hypothetical protein
MCLLQRPQDHAVSKSNPLLLQCEYCIFFLTSVRHKHHLSTISCSKRRDYAIRSHYCNPSTQCCLKPHSTETLLGCNSMELQVLAFVESPGLSVTVALAMPFSCHCSWKTPIPPNATATRLLAPSVPILHRRSSPNRTDLSPCRHGHSWRLLKTLDYDRPPCVFNPNNIKAKRQTHPRLHQTPSTYLPQPCTSPISPSSC